MSVSGAERPKGTVRVLVHLAVRSLVRSPVSLVLMIAAVAAGVGFQIPNTANLEGYSRELLEKGVGRDAGHVTITAADTTRLLDGAAALDAALRRLPFVRASSVRLQHGGVLLLESRTQPVRVRGVDPARETEATSFCARLARGRCMAPGAEDEVVLGNRIVEQLGADVGDVVRLVMPVARDGEDGVHLVSGHYAVVGVLTGGGSFQSDYYAFLPLGRMQQLLGKPDAASSLVAMVHEPERSGAYAAEIARLAPGVKATPWWSTEQFVADAIAGNRTLGRMSMAMAILAVAIPVLALLYIHVLRERRQIAILAALGFDRRALFVTHLFEAALVGVAGVALGIALGEALCAWFRVHPIFAQGGFAVRPLAGWSAVLWPSGVLLAVTIAAGVVPAIEAARADPAVGLRED